MFVAASTECFPDIPIPDVIDLLRDLEFTAVEISLHENSKQMPPSRIVANFDEAVRQVRDTHRLDISSFDVEIAEEGEAFFDTFKTICRFAKATKVVTLTVPSSELGTPFNEEVERLQRMVDIAGSEGVRVAIRSQLGRLSEDPDTVMVLCDNVHGLGLSFDPSHYMIGVHKNKNVDKLMKYVFHVRLRDTKKDQLQVRIGQGEIEYGRIITQLQKLKYDRALCVHILPMEDCDQRQELRKLRLLLESQL